MKRFLAGGAATKRGEHRGEGYTVIEKRRESGWPRTATTAGSGGLPLRDKGGKVRLPGLKFTAALRHACHVSKVLQHAALSHWRPRYFTISYKATRPNENIWLAPAGIRSA